MSIKEEAKVQKEKIKALPFKKKMENIWYHYKAQIIIGVCVLLALGYVLKSCVFDRPMPYAFSAMALNSTYYLMDEQEPVDKLMAGFAEKQGFDLTTTQNTMTTSNFIDLDTNDTLTLATDMKIIAEAEHGELDVLIGTPALLDFYVINNFYRPLNEQISEETYKTLEEAGLIYYYHDERDNSETPMAIYIQDFPRIKESGLYPEGVDVVLGIVQYSPRQDVARAFVDYIMEGWEPEVTEETEESTEKEGE